MSHVISIHDLYQNPFVSNGIYSWNQIIDMQFTGLIDKNGVEIFAGDVIRQISYCPCIKKDIIHTWVVKADKQYTGFHPFTSLYSDQGSVRCIERYCSCYVDKDEIVVIGNIYKNPELLSL